MGEADSSAQICPVALGPVSPCRTLALASAFVAAEWLGQAAVSSRLSAGLALCPAGGMVTSPRNSYLHFAKHCQMSSLGHNSGETADFVVLKNRTQLVFPNYEGRVYLKH